MTVASWPFAISVLLVIANDLYLKGALSNWFTGKLSDFAGLYFVSLLAFNAFPRNSLGTAGLLAVLFVFWKSPLAQPTIDLASELTILPIGRVVDYSDLVALSVLPLARVTARSVHRYTIVSSAKARVIAIPMCAAALSATLGTTVPPTTARYLVVTSSVLEPVNARLVTRVAEIARNNGLACSEDVGESLALECHGKGIWIRYREREQGTDLVSVVAMPGSTPDMDQLTRDLETMFRVSKDIEWRKDEEILDR